jgi:small subunit ribosomal protein S19e
VPVALKCLALRFLRFAAYRHFMKIMNVSPEKLIARTAAELRKYEKIKPPAWTSYIKTGVCAERPPEQVDFWWLRAAAMLRRIYLTGPVGVSRLRTAFGARRRRGRKPAHHKKAGGKIIRLLLQQLEAEGLIAKVDKPRAGRTVTPKGQRLLDSIAAELD